MHGKSLFKRGAIAAFVATAVISSTIISVKAGDEVTPSYGMTGARRVLEVTPQIQQTPVWCWAAVSAMILDFFGETNANRFGNWQCGFIGVYALARGNLECNLDCGRCIVPAGSAQVLAHALETYPRQIGSSMRITTEIYDRRLSKQEIVDLIRQNRPIITGINPGNPRNHFGTSEHVALLIGFRDLGDTLVINDPAPYARLGRRPYEDAGGRVERRGRYSISYDDFVSGLGWNETITVDN